MPDYRTRRRFLAATTAVALAGCAGLDDGSTDGDDPENSDSETTTPTTDGGDATAYELATAPAFDDPDATSDGVATYRNVEYAETPEIPLALDLHRPATDEECPLLVHVHGGGWATGNRVWDAEGRRHAEMGIAAATVDYRLSGTATYPAAVRDVVAAVTWLRRDAADAAGIDPDRVVLIGESAGAHLSALVGTAPDVEAFHPPGVDPVADDVDGVVGISGIYHLTEEGTDDEPLTNAFFGCTGSECPERYREGSPATHVDADSPPTLLYHGTEDGVVPYRASTMYRDDLQAAGVPATLITGEGGAHVTPYEDPWGDRMRTAQNEFLAERLALDVES